MFLLPVFSDGLRRPPAKGPARVRSPSGSVNRPPGQTAIGRRLSGKIPIWQRLLIRYRLPGHSRKTACLGLIGDFLAGRNNALESLHPRPAGGAAGATVQ